MATNMDQNPTKTLDLSLPPADEPLLHPSQDVANDASSAQPPSLQPPLSNDASSTTNGAESKGIVNNDAPLSDIQKKMRRAERFGISVQLSEQEKRNSRAQRFGTRSTLQAPAASKSDELKRNARAERFGIPSPATADSEAKKKARLAKFAPVSEPDPLEEEKRKARALRFSNPPSTPPSQADGKGNIAPKAAIAGKAGGGA